MQSVQLANQWAAAILAACKPVSEAVPLIYSNYVPPTKIMTSVCSGFTPTSAMLNYAALALVFTAMTIDIPHTVSSLVGRSIGLGLAHAFEAAYIARTITIPITSAISSGYKKLKDKGMERRAAAETKRCKPFSPSIKGAIAR